MTGRQVGLAGRVSYGEVLPRPPDAVRSQHGPAAYHVHAYRRPARRGGRRQSRGNPHRHRPRRLRHRRLRTRSSGIGINNRQGDAPVGVGDAHRRLIHGQRLTAYAGGTGQLARLHPLRIGIGGGRQLERVTPLQRPRRDDDRHLIIGGVGREIIRRTRTQRGGSGSVPGRHLHRNRRVRSQNSGRTFKGGRYRHRLRRALHHRPRRHRQLNIGVIVQNRHRTRSLPALAPQCVTTGQQYCFRALHH